MTESVPAIVVRRVTKTFAVPGQTVAALEGIDAVIRPGIVTGLLGPDGAGKSTFMRLCAGLLRADSGEMTVLGIDVRREPMRVQSRIGYMPQRFGLYEDLTVRENMELYADLQGVPAGERAGRYEELLKMAGLERFTGRLAGKLSGGMKQKLGLVCALVRQPDLLLLDEPTVGVDPVSRRELWHIVYRLVDQGRVTVLLSTAYLDEAQRCAEVLLLHKGRVIGQDDPAVLGRSMEGRTFLAAAPGMGRRKLQSELEAGPEVLDALVTGRRIRIITREGRAPALANRAGGESIDISPVPPRFEDYFIARLKEDTGSRDAHGKIILRNPPPAGGGNADSVIVADELERRFGAFRAVKGVSFRVGRGEIFGLLGANGAGKTTTFRMLCGLLPITSGQCEVAGMDLREAAAAARRKIGYMAQKFSLYGSLTVRQNLQFFSSAYGLRGTRRREQIRWALAAFDLDRYAGTDSRMLPQGYKQRLALAVALMHEPAILFLDEPTSGVDPLARREFWAHINSLAEQGVTVLVTTHFMEEAEYCDRLVIMAEGEVLAQGTPEEIKAMVRAGGGEDVDMEQAFIGLLESRQGTEAGT
ncbi:MAG: ATP-binding cassette domain-containing protein [Desulfobulbaceae bacterium]|nr:ATP-binding cassette domain-containing protein [Desulfobulbaceae bacterium]MDY0350089.1 ATP-binding cassette domain-containing protein [Desulfobulbaceae bacterium]